MRMLLNLKNIYKNYGKEPLIVPVLKDVSLEVVQGDYVAIMGPSGSGKTTLMNIIGCLDRASTGTYLFEDEDISEMNDERKPAQFASPAENRFCLSKLQFIKF